MSWWDVAVEVLALQRLPNADVAGLEAFADGLMHLGEGLGEASHEVLGLMAGVPDVWVGAAATAYVRSGRQWSGQVGEFVRRLSVDADVVRQEIRRALLATGAHALVDATSLALRRANAGEVRDALGGMPREPQQALFDWHDRTLAEMPPSGPEREAIDEFLAALGRRLGARAPASYDHVEPGTINGRREFLGERRNEDARAVDAAHNRLPLSEQAALARYGYAKTVRNSEVWRRAVAHMVRWLAGHETPDPEELSRAEAVVAGCDRDALARAINDLGHPSQRAYARRHLLDDMQTAEPALNEQERKRLGDFTTVLVAELVAGKAFRPKTGSGSVAATAAPATASTAVRKPDAVTPQVEVPVGVETESATSSVSVGDRPDEHEVIAARVVLGRTARHTWLEAGSRLPRALRRYIEKCLTLPADDAHGEAELSLDVDEETVLYERALVGVAEQVFGGRLPVDVDAAKDDIVLSSGQFGLFLQVARAVAADTASLDDLPEPGRGYLRRCVAEWSNAAGGGRDAVISELARIVVEEIRHVDKIVADLLSATDSVNAAATGGQSAGSPVQDVAALKRSVRMEWNEVYRIMAVAAAVNAGGLDMDLLAEPGRGYLDRCMQVVVAALPGRGLDLARMAVAEIAVEQGITVGHVMVDLWDALEALEEYRAGQETALRHPALRHLQIVAEAYPHDLEDRLRRLKDDSVSNAELVKAYLRGISIAPVTRGRHTGGATDRRNRTKRGLAAAARLLGWVPPKGAPYSESVSSTLSDDDEVYATLLRQLMNGEHPELAELAVAQVVVGAASRLAVDSRLSCLPVSVRAYAESCRGVDGRLVFGTGKPTQSDDEALLAALASVGIARALSGGTSPRL